MEQSSESNFTADKVDLLCEFLIVESIINESFIITDKNEKIFTGIQNTLKENFTHYYNFDELASDYKISQSLLRKIWAKYCSIPPAKYSMQLRMNEACRLMIETKLSIGDIAEKLNFQDPLYFSRKFRKEYGITASEYRNTYQIRFKPE